MNSLLSTIRRGFCALVLIATNVCLASGADDALQTRQQVDRFLARLGLVDLQILHLEQSLNTVQKGNEATRLARRIADLYASQLMRYSADAARYQEQVARITVLLKRFPEAKTSSLQVMLLQADYNRAESLASRWIGNSTDQDSRSKALGILSRISPPLDQLQTQLNKQADQLKEQLDAYDANLQRARRRNGLNSPDNPDTSREVPATEDAFQLLQSDWRRLQGIANRATYVTAWSLYYQGFLQSVDQNSPLYAKSRRLFELLLGIEPGESLKDIDSDWLNLETEYLARSVIGLGLAEAITGQVANSRICFQWLDQATVSPAIRDEGSHWYVRSLCHAAAWQEVLAYAERRISRFSGSATNGQLGLCLALVQAAYGAAKDTPQKAALSDLGLKGLARLQQRTLILGLIARYQIQIGSASGMVLQWIKGQQLLTAAEQTRQPEDYRKAADILAIALASKDASSQASLRSRCRYDLAMCQFRLGNLAEAGPGFEESVSGLKAAGETIAVDALWNAFVCYKRLGKDDARYLPRAINILASIKRDYPQHEYARQADRWTARLMRDSSPQKVIRQLQNVGPEDDGYLDAQYDLCTLLHQQWSSQRANATQATKFANGVRQAADLFDKLADTNRDARRRVKVLVLAAEVSLLAKDPLVELAAGFLDRAKPLAEPLPTTESTLADYHYQWLRVAQSRVRDDSIREHANWLVKHTTQPTYRLVALVSSAQAVDRQLANAAGAQRQALLMAGYQIYHELSQRLGAGREAILGRKNARVAASRLASYATALKKYPEAITLLDRLVSAFPKDRNYLKRAGRVQLRAGNPEQSLAHWRTLLAGSAKSSDTWFEAKYHQILCLQKIDKNRAQQVLRQFKLLHPKDGPPAWRERFRQLTP
ncbi:MAG: hypothetical protein CMJ70_21175 [Planctomycetaceae bacterium]|nr:hypothetical protein [Planctomycetaceae bacterium]HAA67853.1 hypothetical protein [Planctomycetaceae bacterium]